MHRKFGEIQKKRKINPLHTMNRKLLKLVHTRRGLALISVLAMVTLATVIVLALFSVSDSEFKSSKIYAGGNAARQIGDAAVNVVIGQLRSATVDPINPNTAQMWVSQPGAIRVYNPNGTLKSGHKLYSDSEMMVQGENGDQLMSRDAPDSNWDTTPDRYVDLNEPVVRAEDGGRVTRIFFPIVDPRASVDTVDSKKVEGFSYSELLPTGGSINGVVKVGDADRLRLPMPVEWMYLLKDGTLGVMGQGGSWTGSTGAGPSAENPIVGRVAFWTDDESSKINVNTASEPGYWALPTFFHERDKGWVDSPPALNEYQRFPGHPATVALSTVLYPSGDAANPRFLDTYTQVNDAGVRSVLDLKESIYTVVPKIAAGGSRDGTYVYVNDYVDKLSSVEGRINHKEGTEYLTTSVNILPPGGKSERLFASLDEFIFSQNVTGGKRVENNFSLTNITPSVLEKTRFFMTAHSRAPELNIFGRPRVAMWPVPDVTLGEKYRTGYDKAISTVATLSNLAISKNTYFFSRRNPDSGLEDIGHDAGGASGLIRNLSLMTYLDKLMGNPENLGTHPGFPGGGNFGTKYPGSGGPTDSRQILVEIFDYIRCTNLYDSFLAPKFTLTENTAANVNNEIDQGGMDYRWDPSPPLKQQGVPGVYEIETGKTDDEFKLDERLTYIRKDTLKAEGKYFTYTAPRFKVTKFTWTGTPITLDLQNEVVASGIYPGHGQVTPAEWQVGGQKYKGFGRFPTLSEVGLHFICTADGLNDKGSFRVKSVAQDWTAVEETTNKKGVSGGRTAEKLENTDDASNEKRRVLIGKLKPKGPPEDIKNYWYSNFPPEPSVDTIRNIYGCEFKATYPRGDDTNPANHPGCQPENWNATLELGAPPLTDTQKRIQVAIILEFFVPSLGYTKYSPEWTFVIDGEGLQGIKVRDVETNKLEPVFSTTEDQVLKSNVQFSGSLSGLGHNALGTYPLGGTSGPRATTQGRRVKGIRSMPEDPGYDSTATDQSGIGQHYQLYNYPLVGNFMTVDRSAPLEFVVERPLIARLYSDHDWQKQKKSPVQTIELAFPAKGEAPPPELVRYSIERRIDETYKQLTIDAPRWWAFNWGGALHRWIDTGSTFRGAPNWSYSTNNTASNDEENRRTRGRFENLSRSSVPLRHDQQLMTDLGTTSGRTNLPVNTLIYGYAPTSIYTGVLSRPEDRDPLGSPNRAKMDYYEPGGGSSTGRYLFHGSDTVRSILPKYGDYRIIAARKTVPDSMFKPHPLYNTLNFFAHNFSSFFNTEAGFYRGGEYDTSTDPSYRLVPFPVPAGSHADDYPINFIPDTPQTKESSNASVRYGDFDNGPGDSRDGAYINKPDEGNLSAIQLWIGGSKDSDERYYRNAYFHHQWMQLPARESFFTPNRMISSPGMFGSLPTGVYGSRGKDRDAGTMGQAWRTLLFRPYTTPKLSTGLAGIHPGAPAVIGGVTPADHYIMDLFWMPIVGPYAISDSWSTAGKININFQIVPFTYINRATAMYAAMKGEIITAVPQDDAKIPLVAQRVGNPATKSYKQYRDASAWPPLFFTDMDKANPKNNKYWHRYINLAATTNLMKYRMDWTNANASPMQNGLFRSASQICEVHLVPQNPDDAQFKVGDVNTPTEADGSMSAFWQEHSITGDNTRERPYANLYQKLTARSNTFRVFYRAQALKKARSIDPGTVRTVSTSGESTDTILAEYRGSALLERYLDLNATLPDYTTGGDPFALKSLESFYRYRVLESKQFTP